MCNSEKGIYEINEKIEVKKIPEYEYMYHQILVDKNISVSNLRHLLKGLPLVDVSDGEYIHWLQLDSSALEYVSTHFKISQ